MLLKLSAILLLTVAAYWPALHADFVYDDAHFVRNNDAARLGVFHLGTARPLTLATYWLNFHTTGDKPLYFHLTNLAIHLINGFLVFLAAQTVLGMSEAVALLASGVFLLHPLASEATIYISGRSELLATMFMLLSVLLFARSCSVLAAFAFILAVASKEIGLLTPILWWIVDKRQHQAARPILLCLLVGAVISPLRVYMAVIWQNAHLSGCYAILSLLGRSIVPFGLSVDHDFTSQPWICGLLAAWIIALAVFVALRCRDTIGGMGILWIAALTLPHALVEPPGYFTEHHMYAPMVGISVLLASLLQMKGTSHEQFRSEHRSADLRQA